MRGLVAIPADLSSAPAIDAFLLRRGRIDQTETERSWRRFELISHEAARLEEIAKGAAMAPGRDQTRVDAYADMARALRILADERGT